ncbi:MAG: YqhA family protein [Pyrinomonadaceae bacterium]
MKWLVEKSRYLSHVAIAGMLFGVLAALYVGAEKTLKVIQIAILHHESNSPTLYVLFEALDSFLVAVALLVISVSLYELFIGGLKVPDWMLVKNLDEMKAKFGSVLIPIMAVKFVQKLLQSESSLETLYYGIAVALVAFALTAFNYVADKEKEAELERNPEEGEMRAKDLKNS